MCTVTLIARRNGYALGMNRDEKLTRVNGLPPRELQVNGHRVLNPSEPSGGTWIALNDSGATFALINWYSITTRVGKNPVSRGNVVNAVRAKSSVEKVIAALVSLPLKQTNPFRLIGVFPATREVVEWRWDLKKLSQRNCTWKMQQWISSGCDEPQAQRFRSATFRAAMEQKSFGTTEWLRRLHRSHAPECGPFSTCMHRADAATVSYTEVSISTDSATMRHTLGSPCETSEPQRVLKLKLTSLHCDDTHATRSR
jgi:hypothetical protein